MSIEPTDEIEAPSASLFSTARTDLELIEGVRQGDDSALGELYDRHSRAVYSYAASIVQAPEDAEEVMQDTFVTAWEKLGAEPIVGDSALPWLLVTSRNKSMNRRRLNERRNSKHVGTGIDERVASILPSLEDQLIQAQLMAQVDAAVEKLGELDRSVYQLCLAGQSSYAEAAAVLGVSNGSIRNRLSRLKASLRKELSIIRGAS